MKYFYRLVYVKRRLFGPGRRSRRGTGPAYRPPRRRVRIPHGAKPLAVFAVIVGIALLLSALFAGLGGFGGLTGTGGL